MPSFLQKAAEYTLRGVKPPVDPLDTFNQVLTPAFGVLPSIYPVNGSFSAWTAGNPDSWTTTEPGSSQVSERAVDEGFPGAGLGACNFYSPNAANTPRISQSGLLDGTWYYAGFDIGYRQSGTIRLSSNSGGLIPVKDFYELGQHGFVTQARGTNLFIQAGITPVDLTLDSVDVRPITLNTEKVAASADGRFSIEFQEDVRDIYANIVLLYRISSSAAFWAISHTYKDSEYKLSLYSVNAGLWTLRAEYHNVGRLTKFGAVCNDNNHRIFVHDDTTVGSITNNAHKTATGYNVVYHPEYIPLRLRYGAS